MSKEKIKLLLRYVTKNEKNKCEKAEFFLDIILCSLFIYVFFEHFFLQEIYFKPLDIYLKYENIEYIYVTVFGANLFLFYYFTNRIRSYKNILAVGGAPIVVISVIKLMCNHYKIVFFVLGILGLYFGFISYLIMKKIIQDRKNGRKRIEDWIFRGGVKIRKVTNMCFVFLFLIFISIKIWDAGNTIHVTNDIASVSNIEDTFWDSNVDKLIMFKEYTFEKLSKEEKAEALQGIIDLEIIYFGIEPVNLQVKLLDDESTYGYYENEKRMITLNSLVLEFPAIECIEIILHECYHAYQHACIDSVDWYNVDNDLRMYKDVHEWEKGFENYISCDNPSDLNEYMDYYNQICEIDARDYAEERVYLYIQHIRNME